MLQRVDYRFWNNYTGTLVNFKMRKLEEDYFRIKQFQYIKNFRYLMKTDDLLNFTSKMLIVDLWSQDRYASRDDVCTANTCQACQSHQYTELMKNKTQNLKLYHHI